MKFRPVFLTPDVNKLQSQMSNDNLDTPSLDSSSPSLSGPFIRGISLGTPNTLPSTSVVLSLPNQQTARNEVFTATSELAEPINALTDITLLR